MFSDRAMGVLDELAKMGPNEDYGHVGERLNTDRDYVARMVSFVRDKLGLQTFAYNGKTYDNRKSLNKLPARELAACVRSLTQAGVQPVSGNKQAAATRGTSTQQDAINVTVWVSANRAKLPDGVKLQEAYQIVRTGMRNPQVHEAVIRRVLDAVGVKYETRAPTGVAASAVQISTLQENVATLQGQVSRIQKALASYVQKSGSGFDKELLTAALS